MLTVNDLTNVKNRLIPDSCGAGALELSKPQVPAVKPHSVPADEPGGPA